MSLNSIRKFLNNYNLLIDTVLIYFLLSVSLILILSIFEWICLSSSQDLWRPLPIHNLVQMGLDFLGLLWVFCGIYVVTKENFRKHVVHFFDVHALWILFLFAIVGAIWSGLNIFNNSFEPWFLAGSDALAEAQVYHNISSGNFKQTVFYDISYLSQDGHAPIFVQQVKHWCAYIIYSIVYLFHPYPPMHVLGKIIFLLSLGSFGIFYAARAFGARSSLALFLSVSLYVLPHVEMGLYSYHCVESPSFCFFPFVIGSLVAKNKRIFICSCLALALVSVPSMMMVAFLGILIIVVAQKLKYGAIALLIAAIVYVLNYFIDFYVTAGIARINMITFTESSLLKQFSQRVDSTLPPQVIYLFSYLCCLAFAPIIAFFVDRKNVWLPTILFLMATIYFIQNTLRGDFPFGHYRNHNLLIILYLLATYAIVKVKPHRKIFLKMQKKVYFPSNIYQLAFFSSVIVSSLYITKYLPWSVYNYANKASAGTQLVNYTPNPFSRKYSTLKISETLQNISQIIPKNAYLGFDCRGRYEAWFANRLHAWRLHRSHPLEKLQYFVISKAHENFYVDKPYILDSKLIYKDNEVLVYKKRNLQTQE